MDPRGRIDRIAGEEPLARARGDAEPDEGFARVDPDAEAGRDSRDARQPLRVLDDPERCPDRSLGVVLVGSRHPEHPEDGIADELLNDPAMGLDLGSGKGEVGGQDPVHVLGVRGLRRRGEADEVAEERRDDFALLGERDRGGRPERGRAGRAEPEPDWALGPA